MTKTLGVLDALRQLLHVQLFRAAWLGYHAPGIHVTNVTVTDNNTLSLTLTDRKGHTHTAHITIAINE
jgi:hypothetical protein